MKRAGIAYCAEIEVRRFDLYVQREQLTFAKAEPPKHYSLQEAYELRLFLDLVDQGGASLEVARAAVLGGTDALMVHPLNQSADSADLWVGMALVQDPEMGGGEESWHSFPIAGPLSEIAKSAEAQTKQFGDEARLARLVVGNASGAARFVRHRANELGLPEAKDFSEVVTLAALRKSYQTTDEGK